MKKIGDECGGWLENEEETKLRNHLRWARIRVKGPRVKIPTSIEIGDGELIHSLPIWCESPTTFRKKDDITNRGDKLVLGAEPEDEVAATAAPATEILHRKGKEVIGVEIGNINVSQKKGYAAVKEHVTKAGGFVKKKT